LTGQQLRLGLIVLAVVALGLIGYLVFGLMHGDVTSGTGQYAVTVTDHDRTMGSSSAPVVIVEYAAPTCPHCAAFDMEILPLIKKTFIDTGKVYYVFRVFPLSPVDSAAEAIGRCLSKENYFPFIDQLYRNQSRWDPDGYDIPDVHAALVAMGVGAGLSAQKVDTCINDTSSRNAIDKVGTDAESKYGIDGTPSFLVNGELRVGESTWADWQDYLNKRLASK
jgi:protein-disulfide isomerase